MLDCKIVRVIIVFYSLQIISPQPPISLDDVEHVIEGDIENDEYFTNAMEAIEKYYNVSMLIHFYIHIIINYLIINNNVFIITDERTARIITTGCAINIRQPQ